jgi:hypothetical protein
MFSMRAVVFLGRDGCPFFVDGGTSQPTGAECKFEKLLQPHRVRAGVARQRLQNDHVAGHGLALRRAKKAVEFIAVDPDGSPDF